MAKIIPNRVFEDYDPPSDLVTEDGCDTLLIYLPGFKKEQLKVQLTISRMLKISGERPLGDNKYRRFQKEFRLPSNCDTKDITAKFEGGILYIRQPKLITPAAPVAPPSAQPQKAAAEVPPPSLQPPHSQPQQLAPPSLPLPPPPQPQSQKHSLPPPPPPSPPQPQLQHALPPSPPPLPPQPQFQQERVKGEVKAEEEEKAMKMKTEEMGSEDEEKIDKCGIIQHQRPVANSGLFRELSKSDNVKRLGVSIILVLIIAFYIFYMFKSLMENGHEFVTEYYPEL